MWLRLNLGVFFVSSTFCSLLSNHLLFFCGTLLKYTDLLDHDAMMSLFRVYDEH